MGVRPGPSEKTQRWDPGNRDRHLRRVEGVSGRDRVPNADIRRRLGVEAVLELADRKKEWRRKKIEEILQERLVRRVFEEEVHGRRQRGQPRKRWREDI